MRAIGALRLPFAFLLRDLRIEISFKAGLALRVASGLMTVVLFYFVARVIRNVSPASFEEYGGYFAFVVCGLAMATYLAQGIGEMASRIRESQAAGTLEMMVLSPTRFPALLLSASLPIYVLALVSLVAHFVAAGLLGVDFGGANIPAAALSLIVATPSFAALGLFAVAPALVTQRGNPVSWVIRSVSVLLGGVLYPISVLPPALETMAQGIPITHAVDLMRGSLLLGEGVSDLWPELLTLVALTAVLLPLGLLACQLALRLARTDGSLAR
jgi:ABC-2 type transport system permease protein